MITHDLMIDDLVINVIRKRIRNIYLRVDPQTAQIRVTAPIKLQEATLYDFISARLDWVKKRVAQANHLHPRHDYVSGETHHFLGEQFRLSVVQSVRKELVLFRPPFIELYVRDSANTESRKKLLDKWYRSELHKQTKTLMVKWQNIINVDVTGFNIKRMKTKWGTCNTRRKFVWLNLELIKMPLECLEYVVVHELVHFLERGHNRRFYGFMQHYLPDWKARRKKLNSSHS